MQVDRRPSLDAIHFALNFVVFTVAKREDNLIVVIMNECCCYYSLILYIVTVPSIKVIVERGGTYGFIKGKQNSNQFKERSFNSPILCSQ